MNKTFRPTKIQIHSSGRQFDYVFVASLQIPSLTNFKEVHVCLKQFCYNAIYRNCRGTLTIQEEIYKGLFTSESLTYERQISENEKFFQFLAEFLTRIKKLSDNRFTQFSCLENILD